MQEINHNLFIPMPVVLVGTIRDGKPNCMAVGWISRVNGDPPMYAIGIHANHYTPDGIRESGSFSINLPGGDLLEKVDYAGLVSGKNVDKSDLFEYWYGREKNAPMISEAKVCIECHLYHEIRLPTHWLFIGEATGVYADEKHIKNNAADIASVDPLILTMTDNTYWHLGEPAGKAWSDGKKLKEKNPSSHT